ncbi:hypothetical protein [Clostridium sp.]|uniref:hypothetical protein n=1 Tax=Clostridium sp. TaxID=1506 RepID=UPI00260EDD6B|nr:hypothetical protein [Clostridium sp.]
MKKKLTIFMVLVLVLALVGCENSIVKKSIEEAKLSIESKDYDKALTSLQTVLDEDSDNEEGKKLYSIVDSYQKAKKSFEENNVDEAKKLLDEINDEYVNYMIKDDIDALKQQVENKIKEIELIDSNLTKLLGLVDEKKYDEASALFEEINKSSLNDEQKAEANELKTRIDTELAEIEAQKKAKEEARLAEETRRLEEEKRKAEENKFDKRRAVEILVENQPFYASFDIIEDNGRFSFGKNGKEVIWISLWDQEVNQEKGLKYYAYRLTDVEMHEAGGTGTIENGYIYEDGTIGY